MALALFKMLQVMLAVFALGLLVGADAYTNVLGQEVTLQDDSLCPAGLKRFGTKCWGMIKAKEATNGESLTISQSKAAEYCAKLSNGTTTVTLGAPANDAEWSFVRRMVLDGGLGNDPVSAYKYIFSFTHDWSPLPRTIVRYGWGPGQESLLSTRSLVWLGFQRNRTTGSFDSPSGESHPPVICPTEKPFYMDGRCWASSLVDEKNSVPATFPWIYGQPDKVRFNPNSFPSFMESDCTSLNVIDLRGAQLDSRFEFFAQLDSEFVSDEPCGLELGGFVCQANVVAPAPQPWDSRCPDGMVFFSGGGKGLCYGFQGGRQEATFSGAVSQCAGLGAVQPGPSVRGPIADAAAEAAAKAAAAANAAEAGKSGPNAALLAAYAASAAGVASAAAQSAALAAMLGLRPSFFSMMFDVNKYRGVLAPVYSQVQLDFVNELAVYHGYAAADSQGWVGLMTDLGNVALSGVTSTGAAEGTASAFIPRMQEWLDLSIWAPGQVRL
jgi:hypothetical protein